jgi:Family of unknown function (DUF5641)
LPPQKWLLGRIIKTHPGDDGNVRVATVRAKEGEKLRPLVKLARLPIEQPENTISEPIKKGAAKRKQKGHRLILSVVVMMAAINMTINAIIRGKMRIQIPIMESEI